ncbi:hypothetical protein [Halobellus salinisoli]|uniref:hypothetical protein n=1 Tax=Halobellus salinisoli TaxID=3108500 RepID=UPI00300BA179
MNVFDFTTSRYERLLNAILEANWDTFTVKQYLEAQTLSENFVVLRHDVDRKVRNALRLARLEAERGITATYYFRTSTFDVDIVRQIEEWGHEIGYHYEDPASTNGDYQAAQRRFEENLAAFREVADVATVCAHGSPLSPHSNKGLWEGRLDELAEYGILGEGYLSIDVGPQSDMYYLSETGRTWEAELPTVGVVETTADLIGALHVHPCSGLYILVHPSRWSDSKAEFAQMFAWDASKEITLTALNTISSLHR